VSPPASPSRPAGPAPATARRSASARSSTCGAQHAAPTGARGPATALTALVPAWLAPTWLGVEWLGVEWLGVEWLGAGLVEPTGRALFWAALPLLLGAALAFATLRLALLRSVPAKVLGLVHDPERRADLAPLLERADVYASTATALRTASEGLFVIWLLLALASGEAPGWGDALAAVGLGVPLLLCTGEILPAAFLGGRGDRLLARWLPTITVLLGPLSGLGVALGTARSWLRVAGGMDDDPAATRRVVEGLRGVVVDSEFEGELGETEREIIGNVMEFHDVDVGAVMTPRTEICGVDRSLGLREAVRAAAEGGHSRVPVFDGNLDTVVGVFSTRDVLPLVVRDELDRVELASVLRPPFFVPETKRVSELLAEFRRERVKLAIVLDEYGGTAGLVTIGDILGELVGDLHDEYDEPLPAPLRQVERDLFEVDASLRVSEVNEELDLELPEEADFETVGGFVLAKLGHFPKPGEVVATEGAEIVVTESSDRRIHKLLVRRLVAEEAR
jgi:putative hemolysin